MFQLLLGPDDFSKKEYVGVLAEASKEEAQVFVDAENLPTVDELSSRDLFAKPKIFVLKNLIVQFNRPEIIEKFIASKNHIIVEEEKLDKRSSDNKKLLANKNINFKEFHLPHGQELNKWIFERTKILNGQISKDAVEALAITLGRDNAKETKFGGQIVSVEEVYSLWQADAEIRKLIAFAKGREITQADVSQLVSESGEVDVFELTNAIGDGQKQKALNKLHKFLKEQTGSDEKGAVIQLNALLSEQFRNVAMVQDFMAQKRAESEILESTGWKAGRLFIMKKIAGKFPQKKVLEFLNKLSALDEELKTSQTPPKVLLDLIVFQLLV